ncbi:MAG: hypothetical protein IIB71_16895 [Proteobacteria bacterium]|nr:hypothetical protein [Pseudomonadota bacterium]
MPARILIKLVALTLVVLLQAACVIEVHSGGHASDVSRVFGGIDIGTGEEAGDVESVNGGIVLRDGSSAERVETVNGSVRIYDDVSVYSVETVNGSIRAGRNLKVQDDISTVNGGIDLRKSSVIKNSVSTVNGTISLSATQVLRDVETTNGDIRLLHGSVVSGDVIFHQTGSILYRKINRPRLVVDADSVIKGAVHLYRQVKLEIADDAWVGEIIEHY